VPHRRRPLERPWTPHDVIVCAETSWQADRDHERSNHALDQIDRHLLRLQLTTTDDFIGNDGSAHCGATDQIDDAVVERERGRTTRISGTFGNGDPARFG